MHLEIKEILESTDVDLVVRTLEESVRALAKNVVRSEQQLIAFGIGPSPIAKNTRDRAVFNAAAVGTGTCVTVDVSFQASALLGNVSQNDVVRDKILGVLQEARTGIRYRSGVGLLPPAPAVDREPEVKESTAEVAAEVPAMAETAVVAAAVVEEPVVVVAAPVAAEVVTEPVGVEKIPVVAEVERIATPVAMAPIAVERVGTKAARSSGAVAVAEVAAPVEALPAAKVAAVPPAGSASGSRRAVLVLDDREEMNFVSEKTPLEGYAEQHEAGGGVLRVVGWVAVLSLCAGGGWWSVNHPQKVKTAISVAETTVRQLTGGRMAAGEAVSTKADAGVAGTALGDGTASGDVAGSSAAVSNTVGSDAAASDPVASSAAKVAEQDLNAWLLNWAEAMQSHDAEAQAAYYADPVVFYFRTPSVGHAALLESKRSATENKDPNTTLKIEKLKIVRQTADAANVELVKHFVTRTTRSGPVDQKVESQLKVRRINGDWRIVEEHNLG